MVDAYTGEILGIWIGFKAPSRKACAMVIRDCTRRHGRLPEMIVVDGGKEFDSAHFRLMLAELGIDRAERPPEDPRFGKEVERAFGAFKERFLRGMPGYGIGNAKARQVSAAFKASKRASLTPETLLECFEKFIFHGYNNIPKGDSLHTPSEQRIEVMRKLKCCGRSVEWDFKLLLVTSIAAPHEKYTLWPGRGVHVFDSWYCSDRLLAFRGNKKQIEVRLEPYDRSVVYVNAGAEWFPCFSQEYATNRSSDSDAVLMRTSASHDLRELINEIRLESDRRIAEIVNDQLQKA
jgi:putative transposase